MLTESILRRRKVEPALRAVALTRKAFELAGCSVAGAVAQVWWVCGACLLCAACAGGPKILEKGTVVVSFSSEETCGLHNPYEADATGCQLIAQGAIVCDGFGVIDGMLFAGDCEAPATASLLEVQGTSVSMTPVGGKESAE